MHRLQAESIPPEVPQSPSAVAASGATRNGVAQSFHRARRRRRTVYALVTVLATAPPGWAKDLDRLVRALSPMFLAENFAAVCTGVDPSFFDATGGRLGNIHVYAQHTKLEVIDQLTPADANVVLRRSADAAKFLALQRTNEIAPRSLEADAGRVRAWCDAVVRDFVRQVIGGHDANHDAFLQAIAQAKKDGTAP